METKGSISSQIQDISSTAGICIQENVSLRDKNWFKTGGNARFYCEPSHDYAFAQALQFARTHALDIVVLGEGANILISDEGFNGLVIRPVSQTITVHHEQTKSAYCFVEADAGVSFGQLISFCLEHNIGGLEEFSGIPGTVGGSVFINIHYFEHLLSHFLVRAHIINKYTGELTVVDNSWFQFGYNQSRLHQNEYYLVRALFKLKMVSPLEAAYAQGRQSEIIRHRQKRYPTRHTCGSFFRNFYEHEVTLTSNGKKLIFVAYYLDKVGVKGHLRVGNALVSYQHANMIVTNENATSHEVITLARHMQELVYQNFGILPHPECQLVGFNPYPLL